jgi:hypothetical protein
VFVLVLVLDEYFIMGAEQSSARDSAGPQPGTLNPAKTCYYELLGLDRHATDEE